jgi:hypothetical protein
MQKVRLGGAFSPAAPAFLGGTTGRQQGRHSGNQSTSSKSEPTIPMIRISFDTRTDSENDKHPEAWRPEAAARLREIAKRIAAGETMPLLLHDLEGNVIGLDLVRKISSKCNCF